MIPVEILAIDFRNDRGETYTPEQAEDFMRDVLLQECTSRGLNASLSIWKIEAFESNRKNQGGSDDMTPRVKVLAYVSDELAKSFKLR